MWFSSAVMEWWDEWQLRILVLCSLCAQHFLAFFGSFRKSRIPGWWRSMIWLSYLASDFLATFALTALFSRQDKQKCNPVHGNISIEVLWAPILLMHLGGQWIITAHDIEDNELWMRSLATAAHMVPVAFYVFYKSPWSSWSWSNLMIIIMTLYLFIVAIFKCFDKPLALKRASFSSILGTMEPDSRSTTTTDSEQELEDFVREARTFVQGIPNHNAPPPPTTSSADSGSNSNNEGGYSFLLLNTDKLFADIVYTYSDRLAVLKAFWLLDDKSAYRLLNRNLSDIFDRLYTKLVIPSDASNNALRRCCSFSKLTMALAVVLPTQAMVLLVMELVTGNIKFHEKGYKTSDIIVTIVLLFFTFVLESRKPTRDVRWNDMVSQHSIIDYFARSKRHPWLMSIAQRLQCKDLVGRLCFRMKPCYSAMDITSSVRSHLQMVWQLALSGRLYRMINDCSGELTLAVTRCDQLTSPSLEKPFDESIIIWHLATDFCFHLTITSSGAPVVNWLRNAANRCRKISNYMMHLLFSNPEMLMSGSRKSLLKITDKELKDIFNHVEPPVDRETAMQVIIAKARLSRQGLFHEAWLLAQGLLGLEDNKKMWIVIHDSWLEMLCFSASRSRGYLHAKSLGSGGEFLSYIWLLLSHSGMETFSDKLQRRHHYRLFWRQMREEYAAAAAGGPSTSQGTGTRNAAAAAGPTASKGKDPVNEEKEDATPSTSHGTDLVKNDENAATAEIEIVVVSS